MIARYSLNEGIATFEAIEQSFQRMVNRTCIMIIRMDWAGKSVLPRTGRVTIFYATTATVYCCFLLVSLFCGTDFTGSYSMP